MAQSESIVGMGVDPRLESFEPSPEPTVVWLRGEYDMATQVALSAELSKAIARDDADVILDLAEVEFMDASVISVIVAARQYLMGRSRTLGLRSPTPRARRLVDLCELGRLIVEPDPVEITAAHPGRWAVPGGR